MAETITDKAEARQALMAMVEGRTRIAVLAGAGLSTESGLPDFRSPGGIWSQFRPVTYQEFVADEDARLEDWRRRFIMNEEFARAEPNDGHKALAGLARDGRLSILVTQNVDGLHRRAGTPQDVLVEIHGTATHGHCLDCGRVMSIAAARQAIETTQRAPRCETCGGLVKAAVVSFGQSMPEAALQRAAKAFAEADLAIVVGSALEVYPAANLPRIAVAHGVPLVILNRTPTMLDDEADLLLRSPAAETLHGLL
ncbi:MAG: Sir2 family NAD-dependent protein deacetylase [Hyphomicrobiaceae bacterium]|nr:Sir2 family NAD-dependent protein deacetylase [Hyphomicrobiaceae bacterium]